MSHDGNSGAAQPEYGNDSLDGGDAPYLPAVEASANGIVAVEHRSNEDLQDNTLNAEQHHATSSTEGGPLPPAATLVEIGDGSSLECSDFLHHEPTTYHELQVPTGSYKDVSSDDSDNEERLHALVFSSSTTSVQGTSEQQPGVIDDQEVIQDEPVVIDEPCKPRLKR